MESINFVKRLFQAYYKEQRDLFPSVSNLERREFAFIPWENNVMIRHLGFNSINILTNYILQNVPKHMYSSASLYELPDAPTMEYKNYMGCDLVFDIDADHLDTSCKETHDFWQCQACNNHGVGEAPLECDKCNSKKLSKINWICDECLEQAKEEVFKLINNFLEQDFGLSRKDCSILFSGHRGYHIHIENENLRNLKSQERREIVDYITGKNISLRVFGLKESGGGISRFNQYNYGWPRKIMLKLKDILLIEKKNDLRLELHQYIKDKDKIEKLIADKNDLIINITTQTQKDWDLLKFGYVTWKNLLLKIAKSIGADVDVPVTIDTHRLIRYPDSLHGGSGFKVVEINYSDLEKFDPFSDPVVFSHTNLQKLEITAPQVASIRVRDKTFGPFKKGEIQELPHDIAVFLICKNVAKIKRN